MARQKGVAAKIAEYLSKHPGEEVSVEDISSAVNLRRSQVVQTMWNLRARKPEFGALETIEAGRLWRYNPNPNGVKPSALERPDPGPASPVVKVKSEITSGGHPAAQGPILEVFTRHPNEVITVETLTAATSLDREQVRRAISNLRSKGYRDYIQTVVQGHAWRYSPRPEPEEPEQEPEHRPITRGLYEQIGTVNGVVLVRGEDEEIYALKSIQLDI